MLQVRPFDIEIGQHKVMLNIEEARERGLNAGDRVRVRTKGAATTAILDTTSGMVKLGEIGIFTEALKDLKDPSTVDILPAPKPASLCYIKSFMDKQKLSEDQIRSIVQDIVDNNLSDIELAAYITASYIHDMDSQEVEWLTKAMIETGERIHFDTHPVMDLISRPNGAQGRAEFLEAVYGYLLLAGNAYVEAVPGVSAVPGELHVLRSDRMNLVPGADGWPIAYDYTVFAGTQGMMIMNKSDIVFRKIMSEE
ncbi:MAG TPA: phage portal protein, partial [Methanothrix sp.]|nr:phage portal protein [Methanothrix sp.]